MTCTGRRRNASVGIGRHRLAAIALSLCLGGCSHLALLNPQGPIARSELGLMGTAFVLMLIVIIPVIVMAIWFPWRFRASGGRGRYDPAWCYSPRIDLVVWLVPAIIVAVLGTLTWQKTHSLDPFRPIVTGVQPLRVEVVSLDWKWLFIYPDLGLATVNQLVLPAHVPVSFRLTSDTVMTSFFIPQLGSQIYAMAGRQSRLHLLADHSGVYRGQNQQFSGKGFADMHFQVRVVSQPQFTAWAKRAGQGRPRLDAARFRRLSRPGSRGHVAYFAPVSPRLFQDIIDGFRQGHGAPVAGAGG